MSDSDILSQGEDIVDRGDVEELRRFVTVNSHTASPLLKRASFFNPTGYGPNRGDVAKVLLELGADVDYQGDEYGRLDTPLHTAASFNTVEVATILVEAGANVELRGGEFDRGTPLAYACFFGFPKVADLLISSGATVYNLATASGAGRLDLVRDYLDKRSGLSVDRDQTGGTKSASERPASDVQDAIQRAFQIAVLGGRLEVVRYLLAFDVDVNARTGVEYSGAEWLGLSKWKHEFGEIHGLLLKHAVLREYDDIASELRGRGATWDGST